MRRFRHTSAGPWAVRFGRVRVCRWMCRNQHTPSGPRCGGFGASGGAWVLAWGASLNVSVSAHPARRGVACVATPRAYLATPRAAWPEVRRFARPARSPTDRQRQHTPAPGRISSNPKPAPKSCAGPVARGSAHPRQFPPDSASTSPPHPPTPRQGPFSGAGCVFVGWLAPWGHPTQLARSGAFWHESPPRRRLGFSLKAPARPLFGRWWRFRG